MGRVFGVALHEQIKCSATLFLAHCRINGEAAFNFYVVTSLVCYTYFEVYTR